MLSVPIYSENSEERHIANRILLVVNAKSRKGLENYQQIVKELENQGIKPVASHAIKKPQQLKALVEAAIERHEIDTVVVGGGDGTISLLADMLAKSNIKLGIIPSGTANDFARNLEITTNIEQAVSIIKAGYVQKIDLGKAGDRYFVNVASIGFGAEVADFMNSDLKKLVGPLAYGVAGIQVLKQIRPIKSRLTLRNGSKEKVIEVNALQIAVANGKFYGGGLVSNPDLTLTSNNLSVSIIESANLFNLLTIAPGLLNGSYLKNHAVQSYAVTEVTVETTPNRKINLDGEVGWTTPITFKIAPQALSVFAPKPIIDEAVK